MRKKRFEKISVGIKRYTANHVAECGSEKYRKQYARTTKHEVPETRPHVVVELMPQLDAGRAQDQQPKHHDQRQIESAERRGIESRKRKIKRPAGGEQPNFVTVPDRPDRAYRQLAFAI